MKRREFLGLAAAGAAGLVLPATARTASSLPAPTANPHLLAFLHDEQTVSAIGRSYRELVPHEDDAQILADAILGAPGGMVPVALGTRLGAQVQDDFAGGRTVNVHGWILSVTEARQCALYSLQQD